MSLTFDEVTRRLREEHRADVVHVPGGCTWACSCGKSGQVGASYPTEAQAAVRRDRHLRAARARIERAAEPGGSDR